MTDDDATGDASQRTSQFALAARARETLPFDRRDRQWLGLSLLPGLVAVAVYLATNPYPAYGGGLYVQIASEIAANGYAPPASIPGYTRAVPFGYPPLQFYLLAVLLDLGFDPISVARFLPGVAVVAGLVPAYLLGRDYTGSRPAGAVTATLIALNPQVLEWHVSAGGMVRAFAFCYSLTAIYAGYRVFTGERRTAVLTGVVAVALTGLAHPTYALFVVVSYVVLWAGLDRSVTGFARGLAVGLGALVLAAPWLAWVVATHGPGVFTAAAGTHGGLGGGLAVLLSGPSPYRLVPFAAAGAVLALRRDATLAGWVVATGFLFQQPRFVYTVGALAAVVAGLALVDRASWGEHGTLSTPDRRAIVAAVLIVTCTVGGGAYLASEMTLTSDPSTPAFIDDESVATMAWAERETAPDATFVVLGDAAEWFPALSGRTILVGPWGVEWESAAAYERQLDAFETASTCRSRACVEAAMASVGAAPEYVVVPTGHYTVRGASTVQFGSLNRSFASADGWDHVHENDGTVVYRAPADR